MPQESGKRILVVDDNHDGADTLAILIRMEGHEVIVAYDTRSGIALANVSVPDIIFHDIALPMMGGYAAARYFRSHQKFTKTLLVAVTAHNATYDRKSAQAAGFDIHLSKPVDFDVLQKVLAHPHGTVFS
jgi:CheY-like chemotaxis protein